MASDDDEVYAADEDGVPVLKMRKDVPPLTDEIVRETIEEDRRWRLELTDEEEVLLRARAKQEGRTVDELVSEAIGDYIERHRRQRISRAIETVRAEDVELLNRLEE